MPKLLGPGSEMCRTGLDMDLSFFASAHADAALSSPKARSGCIAAGAQTRARAQIAIGNNEKGRSGARPSYVIPGQECRVRAPLPADSLPRQSDKDARPDLSAMLKRFPTGRHATNARFRAGMISYIQGDRKAAAAEFDSLIARDSNSTEALAAAYWAGRSYSALGDKSRGNARWRSIISKEPLSYYAVLAAKRLDTTLVASDRCPSNYGRVPAIDTAMNRIVELRDVGMEGGGIRERRWSAMRCPISAMVATAHALR